MQDAEIVLDLKESIKIFVGDIMVHVWFENENNLSVALNNRGVQEKDFFQIDVHPKTTEIFRNLEIR